jgi:hypothetical protein
VRFFGAAGSVVLIVGSASCAALSGLGDYRECTDDCEGASKSPSKALDASQAPGESETADAPATPGDLSAPSGDAGEGREGSDAGDLGLDGSPPPTLVDAQIEDVAPLPIDAGSDSMAPGIDSGPGGGPTCGPLASRSRCNANQVCCANLAAQTNACGAPASCASIATLTCATASDCPGSAPICCARMTLVPDAMNDLPPKCTATGLSASCAASCSDIPPADPTNCKYPPSGTGTVRLCSHDADCTSDTAVTGGGCYNFNGAPVSWCSTALAGTEGKHQP